MFLLLGVVPFLSIPIMFALEVNETIFAPLLITIWVVCLGYASIKERKNVESGDVDLSKQSTGNKILTYSITFIFFWYFIGMFIYHSWFKS